MMSRHTRQLTDPHTDALWGVRVWARTPAHASTVAATLHKAAPRSAHPAPLSLRISRFFGDVHTQRYKEVLHSPASAELLAIIRTMTYVGRGRAEVRLDRDPHTDTHVNTLSAIMPVDMRDQNCGKTRARTGV